jgi:pimeloyl-ACP methyl ester carboxylesterase
VLLHGGSGSWTHWVRNIPVLSRCFETIAPDLPGFGDSDMPPGARGLEGVEALAAVVQAGLEALVPPPAPLDLAGFSFGGIVAGLLAARLGDRVGTLVLVGPNGMALPRGPMRPLASVRPEMSPDEERAAHRWNLATLMIADPDRIDDDAVTIRRTRFRIAGVPESDLLARALPAVRARLVGIWGGRDAFAVPHLEERRRLLASIHPGVDFRVIEGAGHWVIYEAADAANAALLDALGAR